MNQWHNTETEFILDVPDRSKEKEDIRYVNDYANKLFDSMKETTYINENQDKLWFWNNVSFLISTGIIFEETDVLVLNEVMSFFDKTENSFLPNAYRVLNYKSEIVKKIEKEFDIGNGNYHAMLVPFVITTDKKTLEAAPETAYTVSGPMSPLVELEDIVEFIMEVNYKYAAVSSAMGPRLKKQLGTFGIERELNPTTENPYLHGSTRRIVRKGYLDPNTNDAYELINPEQEIRGPSRQYFDENDGFHYRKPVTGFHRAVGGTDIGGPSGQQVKRTQGKQSLYNQIAADEAGCGIYRGEINNTLGVHYRINDYYETTSNKKDKPSYQVYDYYPGAENKNDPRGITMDFTQDAVSRENVINWDITKLPKN